MSHQVITRRDEVLTTGKYPSLHVHLLRNHYFYFVHVSYILFITYIFFIMLSFVRGLYFFIIRRANLLSPVGLSEVKQVDKGQFNQVTTRPSSDSRDKKYRMSIRDFNISLCDIVIFTICSVHCVVFCFKFLSPIV
jgi:hypothetical protein